MDLSSHRFVQYFEPEQVAQLCELATVEELHAARMLFEEGEESDALYLVLAGQVEFSKRIAWDKYQLVTVAQANEFFGEFGVLDGRPRSTRAVANAGTKLAKIPKDGLMEILQRANGQVVIEVFRHIIHHLRLTTDRYIRQVVHKEKMVLVGEMVNTIIHDFKSPFTSIQLASSVLKSMHDDEETQEWCELIQAQMARMMNMAEEALEFARGHSVLQRQPLNLTTLLQQFEKLNRGYFQASGVEVMIQSTDVWINADENKLMRVFQNLVGNAVEALEGHSSGKVEMTVTVESRWAIIRIHDNGTGIPPEIQESLFEPFVTQGKRGGTGLGTAIAKSIVDAHEGQINFQSNALMGTTFVIHLPRCVPGCVKELELDLEVQL